jgi:hypothetical protein
VDEEEHMTDKEPKKIASEMEAYIKKISASKKKSIEFLVKAGICTPKGHLRKPYK